MWPKCVIGLIVVSVLLVGCGSPPTKLDPTLAPGSTPPDQTLDAVPVSSQVELTPTLNSTPSSNLGKLAYVQDGFIWVETLPDGEPRRLTLEGANSEPRWSPSGQWLAFRSGKGGLTVMRADGSAARTIDSVDGARFTWAWSPAADRLAYVTRIGGLAMEDADGSNRRKLAAPRKGGAGTGVRHIAWSPDGEWIAYDRVEILKAGYPHERYASLWRIRIDGGEATELLNAGKPAPYGLIVAGWPPDGSHILYWIDPAFSASLLADGAPLFALPAGGGAPREITQTMLAYPDFLAASPGGAQLAVIEGGGRETWSNKRLGVMNLLSGERITLTDNQITALSPAWSPDGQRLAYVAAPDIGFASGEDEARAGAAQRRIWIANVGNGTTSAHLLTDNPAYRDERPLWSADGSAILFARLSTEDHTSLWLISADGGEPQRVVDELTPGPDWFRYYGYIDWETFYDWWRGTYPEGAQLPGATPALPVEPTVSPTPCPVSTRSPRSSAILYEAEGKLWWLPMDEHYQPRGEPRLVPIKLQENEWINGIYPSPDEQQVIFFKVQAPPGDGDCCTFVYVFAPPDGSPRPLFSGGGWGLDMRFFGWHPNSRQIAYCAEEARWLRDVNTDNETTLFELRKWDNPRYGLLIDGLAFSPDGQRLIVSYTDGLGQSGTVWTANADGSEPQMLFKSAYRIAGLAWSPDGESVAFIGDGVEVMKPSGQNRRPVGSGFIPGGHLAWSPDSCYLSLSRRRCHRKSGPLSRIQGSHRRCDARHTAESVRRHPRWREHAGLVARRLADRISVRSRRHARSLDRQPQWRPTPTGNLWRASEMVGVGVVFRRDGRSLKSEVVWYHASRHETFQRRVFSFPMRKLPSPGRKLAPALALAALTALVVLFFSKSLFTNLIVARGDLYNYFYPYRDYAASALREGRAPLWNPYLFMGAPFLANSQAGFFYPLNLAASWLETARAVSLSIAAHVWIAAIGAYLFARRRFGASVPAALLGGLSFGLGGYLGAQVEHFNQLQALAWMPWLWLAYDFAAFSRRWITRSGAGARSLLRGSLLVGLVGGLMLLAGHMQSVFIALVGLTAYALWPAVEHIRSPRAALKTALSRLVPILAGLGVAAALAAVQLLPTLELAGLSPRQGGLPLDEAVSFSLDPRLLGRALLPDYDGALPGGSEFTTFFGVSALVVMIIGLLAAWSHGATAWQPIGALITDRLTYRSLSVVAFLGIFLALGGFNPIYYLLVKFVPGFDLFRAPARWLALFVFGGSMLASVGLDYFGRGLTRITRIGIAGVMALLIGTTFIGANVTPAGAAGPIGQPSGSSLLLWIAAAILTLALLSALQTSNFKLQTSNPNLQPPTSNLQPPITNYQLPILALCVLELFVATRNLPYHARLTAPDALTSLRPPVAQLLVGASGAPAGRFLSISDIQFDPGDSAELESIYADQLPPDAYYDLLIATKQKEIVAPNQSLTYGLPAVDGYDGGLLPLRNYLTFQGLFLPGDAIQPDGRLREQLESIPDARWLDLMNVKYVITDKVRDRWFDGVFFDLQFETPLRPGDEVWTDQLPPLEANALGIVYSEPKGVLTLAEVELTFEDGSSVTVPLADEPIEQADGLSMTRLRWEEAQRVSKVRIAGWGRLTLRGAALIDERSDTFHSFVLAKDGRFRLAHSGDVKVYEYVDALPRAFVVPKAVSAASDDEALALMQTPDFDPSKTVVIQEAAPPATRDELPITNYQLRFTNYAPEHIELEVKADGDGYLVLTDAWYPGWTATVEGEPVEILRANVYFRAVPIEAGEHRVEFRYEPQAFRVGALISGGALALVVAALVAARING